LKDAQFEVDSSRIAGGSQVLFRILG